MIASQAGGGSGGARSTNTVAQSAAGRRVASTIDFLHTTVREVRNRHVLVFSTRLFPRAEYFQAICLAFKAAFVCVREYVRSTVYVDVLINCLDPYYLLSRGEFGRKTNRFHGSTVVGARLE